mgnify:CR=1 FL=1
MKIHHIGYAVLDLESSIKIFNKLGFSVDSEICIDYKRDVKIVFMSNYTYTIELISPITSNSPVTRILKKNGSTPYHICYYTDNIDKKITELRKEGFILIESPEPAQAIENKKVSFLINKHVGVIELIER